MKFGIAKFPAHVQCSAESAEPMPQDNRRHQPNPGRKIATRDSALIACQNAPETTSDIVTYLLQGQPKILKRIGLHVLAGHAAAAPDPAFTLLADPSYVGEDWCEDEYAELARARFPSLSPDQRQKIFAVIDALPDQYRVTWKQNFAGHYKRSPTPEDERRYDLSVVRDAMWKWQDALPPERKRLIEASVAEFRHRLRAHAL